MHHTKSKRGHRDLKRAALSLAFGLSLGACSESSVTSTRGKAQSTRLAQSASTTDTKSVSSYDPNSTTETYITGPNGSLKGSSVTLPPGALAISVDLVMEESVPLGDTSMMSSLNINSNVKVTPVGSGLIVRPSEAADLTGRLTISLPIGGASLRLSEDGSLLLQGAKTYAVFYKQYFSGSLQDGVIPTKDLRLGENKTIQFEGFFGVYWLAEVSTPIEERIEVATEEPIVNVQNVAVIKSTGIVPEKEVKTKTDVPPVSWNETLISLDTTTRTVKLSSSSKDGQSLKDCKADLYASLADSGGLAIAAGDKPEISYTYTDGKARRIIGRFRCSDDIGRQTMSPWSVAVELPALPDAAPKATYDGNNFFAIRTEIQSRETLRLVVSPDLVAAFPSYRIVNDTEGSTLFDLLTGASGFASKVAMTDGSVQIRMPASALGQLQQMAYGVNTLSIRDKDNQTLVAIAVSVHDFPIFDNLVTTSFVQNIQQDGNGFQGWTSVLAQPVVVDSGAGKTKLSNGILNIINP